MVSPASPDVLPGSLLASLVGAAWVWVLAALLGAAVMPAVEGTGEDGEDGGAGRGDLLGWASLGLGLQSLAWLALGAVSGLRPAGVLLTATALTALAGLLGGRRLADELRRRARRWRELTRPTALVVLGAMAVTVAAATRLAVQPTVFYDDLVYHLGLPRQALLVGHWPALPDFHYSFMPAGWDAAYVLPLSLGGGSGPQLMNVAALGLLAAALFRLARAVGVASAPAAGLAALLLVASPVAVSLAGLAGNDLFVALALTVALCRVVERPGGRRRCLATGLVAGAAWATKYTALPGLAGVALASALATSGSARRRLGSATLVVGAALLLAAPWTLRTLHATGNPVHPALHGVFGGELWSEESAALVARDSGKGRTVSDRGMAAFPLGLRDLLLHSDELGWPSGLDPPLPLLAAVGLLLAAGVRRRGAPLLAAAAVAYAGWCLTAMNLRYALFFVCALTPFAAGTLERALALGPPATARRRLMAGVTVTLVLLAAATSCSRGVRRHLGLYGPSARVLAVERTGVLSRRLGLAAAGLQLAGELPPEARVLLVGDARLALLPRPTVASSAYDRPAVGGYLERASSAAELSRLARADGITHLAVHFDELARWRAQYRFEERLPPDGIARLQAWSATLEPVGQWGPVAVWAIP